MSEKGISKEHNWTVFKLSAFSFAATAYSSCLLISWAANGAGVTDVAIIGSLLAVVYSTIQLLNHVAFSIPLTLSALGILASLVIALPMAGVNSVHLPLLFYA